VSAKVKIILCRDLAEMNQKEDKKSKVPVQDVNHKIPYSDKKTI
jgi:hypothetical protein